MSENQYRFKTIRGRLITSGSTVAGLAVSGAVLAAIFNPVALGVVGLYGAARVGGALVFSQKPAFRKLFFSQMVKSGHIGPLPEDSAVCRIAKEISDSLGRPEPPKVYVIDRSMVTQMIVPRVLPFGFRWLARLNPIKAEVEKRTEKYAPHVFAALPGMNTIFTTNEALASNLTEPQLRFIIAHEMSHLKADFSIGRYGETVAQGMTEKLMLGAGIVAGLTVAGVSLPLTVAGIAAWQAFGVLAGVTFAVNAIFSLGSRVRENRADRNALYITRDLVAAEGALTSVYPAEQKKSHSLLKETFLSHSGYVRRMAFLSQSFREVAKYPAMKAANENSASLPQPQSAAKITVAPGR